mgnify:CR=1 FL=1
MSCALIPKVDELMAATIPAGVVEAAPISMVLKLVGAAMSAAPLVVEVKTRTFVVVLPDV